MAGRGSPQPDIDAAATATSWGPVWIFLGVTYAFSWAWWIPLAVRGTAVPPGQGWPTHLLGLLGPAVGAVAASWAERGREGVGDLWSRVVRWRVRWTWYALMIATAALAVLPLFVKDHVSTADLTRYSGAPELGLFTVFYVLVINGFGEETGWRGFLVERLLRRWSVNRTALAVWMVWALWHLPLFWVVKNFRDLGAGGAVGWLVGVLFGSILLTWLYRSATHSILIVALWHTAYNFATATKASSGSAAMVATTAVIVASVIILRRRATWRSPAVDEAPAGY
jgi:membrane protease YdiL (CAAX protease family)